MCVSFYPQSLIEVGVFNVYGPVVQFGMNDDRIVVSANAAFACIAPREAEAAGSNPARSTTFWVQVARAYF